MKALYSWKERRSKDDDLPPSWKRAEDTVREEYDLVEEHGAYYDARKKDGTPVEIKSCVTEYADGRVGQFKVWESQIEKLLFEGRLALLVYLPDETGRVLATHTVWPHTLSSVGTVTEYRHSTMRWRRLRRIPWPSVIPLDALKFGTRHYFVDHYSDETVEETLFMHPPDEEERE